jgi:CRP/FNR family transcriptional regulator, cyclic AMP receptor protein
MPALTDPNALADLPLFENLTCAQMEFVNGLVRKRQFPAGASVISAETPGELVFVILSGTVKIKAEQADGREVIIAILGPGEVVGELSLIDSSDRSADVVTQEECTVLWMDRRVFDALLESVPQLSLNLLRILSRRVRMATEQVRALCTLDVYGKVARQLLVFADQYGVPTPTGVQIPLRITQTDLAGMVGASRERVNQAVVNLRDRNLITVDTSYRTTVREVARLRAVVEGR